MWRLILILVLTVPAWSSRNYTTFGQKIQGGTTNIANLTSFTVCGWFTATADSLQHRAWDYASSAKYFFFTGWNPRRIGVGILTDGTARTAVSGSVASAIDGRWFYVCASYTPSDGGPRLYVGYAGTTVAETSYQSRTDGTGTNLDDSANFVVGNRSGADRLLSGRGCQVRVWDVVLSAAEMTASARGYPMRPENLKAYWPIHGRHSPEPDVISGNSLTLTDSPATGNHAPIAPAFGWWNN